MAQDTFRIERSTNISAPAEKIFPLIDDFHAWARWSPYEKLDPGMQKTYSGEARGVGAGYAWTGKKAGAGTMTITQAAAPSRVVIALTFTKPMKAQNTAEFLLEPSGGGTRVVWSMTGQVTLMSRVFGFFVNMDKMIGKDFEAGLAAMKAIAEAG
jgi:carbon monoxide dehydrogenase subunit G